MPRCITSCLLGRLLQNARIKMNLSQTAETKWQLRNTLYVFRETEVGGK